MKRVLLILLPIVFFSCNINNSSSNTDPLKEVSFTTSQDRYSFGSVITLTIRNTSAKSVGYNMCSSTLQRKRDEGWVTINSDTYCLLYLLVMKPGNSDQYKVDLGQRYNLGKTGVYRITTNVEFKGETFTLITDPFKIGEAFRPL